MTPQEALQQYYHFDSFRPLQAEIIDSVLQGNDTLALLPTGGGKSICYQIPAVIQEGICLVVSPLISLMRDQVFQLNSRGITASCLVSGMNRHEIELTLNNCVWGNTKLLYVSPERLKSRFFLEHFKQMRLSLIAVDEAHCISQWGYDFRPPYLEIAQIRSYHPKVPVIALTASATPTVVADIRQKLSFRAGHQLFQQSFARPNISYLLMPEDDKRGRMLTILHGVKGSAIVYVRNRRQTQEISQFLNHNGLSSSYYHAGLSQRERDTRQQQWLQSPKAIMVATNAFGMGIDRKDVRCVIHLDIPSSIEEYYQESGRAGRDGLPAYAVLLYTRQDLTQLRHNYEQEYPSPQEVKKIYRAFGNYYQIPEGCGEGENFDFDFLHFCNTYSFVPTTVYNTLRLLEREGLLCIPEREEMTSKLYIPAQREDVYRFQVENRPYGNILTSILRQYGGLTTGFVEIDEDAIARRAGVTTKVVINALEYMQKQDLLAYKPRTTKPQILFMSGRMNPELLQINTPEYLNLKKNGKERLDAMIRFITTPQCRSQQIQTYFGEQEVAPCRNCDVCRSHSQQPSPKPQQSLLTQIRTLLSEEPQQIKSLMARFSLEQQDEVLNTLRTLLDQGFLEQDDSFCLRWKA